MRQITFRLAVALFVLSLGVGFAQAQMQYGIDVSRFQGAINWTAVRSSGISFASAKATEGIDFVDVRFTQNMAGATAAGVYIGPYHFARPDSYNTDPSDAASEANDFVDAILPYYQGSPYTLRPVIDLERLANVGDLAQEKAFLSQWIRNFATVVRTRLGFDPIIYTSPSYANYVLDSDINQYPLWLASWTNDPNSPPPPGYTGIWNNWTFWQYSSTGSVPGISGNVDLDIFAGSLAQLAQFAPGVPEPSMLTMALVALTGMLPWRCRPNRS